MTTKRSSILTEGLRPKGSSHPLSLTRPLWLKKNRIGRVCARLVNFLISSFACAKKEKLKNPKISRLRCLKTHQTWRLSKTVSRKQGRYNPQNLFPAAPGAAFKNSLTWKILKGWKKTSKEFTNCLIFERIKTTASGVPVTKCLTSVQEDSHTETKVLIFVWPKVKDF